MTNKENTMTTQPPTITTVSMVNAYAGDRGSVIVALRVGDAWSDFALSLDSAEQLRDQLHLLVRG